MVIRTKVLRVFSYPNSFNTSRAACRTFASGTSESAVSDPKSTKENSKNEVNNSNTQPVSRWNPFTDPFGLTFNTPFSRMFNDPFFNENFLTQPFKSITNELTQLSTKFPEVDISKTDNGISIEANIPGYTKDNINIDLDGRWITISGEMKEESKRDEKSFHVRERRSGSFTRKFLLPENAQLNNISAKMENGVLQLEIPVDKEKEDKKRIEIN